MSKTIEDDQGNEVVVFTQEELDAQSATIKAEYEAKLLEQANHLKTKTEEFVKGKQSQELKDIERDNAIAEAKRLAAEAGEKATQAEMRRQNAIKEVAMKKFTGDDAELRAKFEESWNLVNLEIKDDADIAKKAELVANMSGLNSAPQMNMGAMSMSSGYAPKVSAVEKEKQDAEYNNFKSSLGLDEFLPAEPNK
jgi:hypothetical protein